MTLPEEELTKSDDKKLKRDETGVFFYSDVIIFVFSTDHFLYLIFPFIFFIPAIVSCKNKFTVNSCMLLYFEHMRDVRI